MKIQLYIDTAQTRLSVKDNLFFIQSPAKQIQVSPMRIDSIAITSAVQLNTAAIKLAARHDIPIYIYDRCGKLAALLRSPDFQKHGLLRRKQLLFMSSLQGNKWAASQIIQKSKEQCITLNRWVEKMPSLSETLHAHIETIKQFAEKTSSTDTTSATFAETVMGYEGNMAKVYFQAVNHIIPEQYRFEGRSRQPGKDYFNTALNYIYGLTYGHVTRALHAAGLDTFVGALHKTLYKETLVFDFIETFRPIMDRLLIQMCRDNLWTHTHFTPITGGFLLNRNGKKLLFAHYGNYLHERIKWKGHVTTIENHLFHEARRLKQLIEKTEVNVSDFL